MSVALLKDLSLASQLLLQLAARHEYAPLHYARVPPLDEEEAIAAAAQLQDRGLLTSAEDAPGVLLLTPVGYALRDEVIGRWPLLHADLRPKLIDHVCETMGVADDSPLRRALVAVDRADHVPSETQPLADLDMPAPVAASMTTSAPHAIVAMLKATRPVLGERILVCGVKGGVTLALCAHLAGPKGRVHGLDWSEEIAAHARDALQGLPAEAAPAEVDVVDDVTLGIAGTTWDVILVNGSIPKVPRDLLEQLAPRGRLLLFLQEAMVDGQSCYVLRANGDAHKDGFLSRFVFTPIFGRWGWDRVGTDASPSD